MSMLTLNGVLQNVYSQPERKDDKTGEIRPASLHAQILAENVTQSGETKLEMVTLKVHTEAFRSLVGQKVRVPSLQTVASCSTRFGMKRSPWQGPKEKCPATPARVLGVADFYSIEEQHNRHAKRTTYTRKRRTQRQNFPANHRRPSRRRRRRASPAARVRGRRRGRPW